MGFDINCGVRLLRTNLSEEDLKDIKEDLTQSLFDHIPVGVGSKGIIPTNMSDLEEVLVGAFSSQHCCSSAPLETPTHLPCLFFVIVCAPPLV